MKLRVSPRARALYLHGALVPITLRPLEGVARRGGESGVDRVEADFLIDTGATHTVIEESLLHRLRLQPLRPAQFVVLFDWISAAMLRSTSRPRSRPRVVPATSASTTTGPRDRSS